MMLMLPQGCSPSAFPPSLSTMRTRTLPVLMMLIVMVVMATWMPGMTQAAVVRQRLDEEHEHKLLFVAKFCYSTSGLGSLRIHTWQVANDTDLKLLFFDDDLWSEVHAHRESLTCQQIRDKVDGKASGQIALREDTDLEVHISALSRPRYWYTAFSRCAQGSMEFDYQLTFLNDGGWLVRQFSVDKQGLLIVFLLYFVLFSLINIINFFYLTTKRVTLLFKVFALISFMEGFSKFCFLIHFSLYADDGIGMPGFASLGDVMDLLVIMGLMGLLVLMSRGWGLIYSKLSSLSNNLLIVLLIFYCLYLAFFLWGDIDINASSTLTTFETPPGIFDLVLRFVLCLFFLVGIGLILVDKNVESEFDNTYAESDEESSTSLHEEQRSREMDAEDEPEEQLLRRSRNNRAGPDETFSTERPVNSTTMSNSDTQVSAEVAPAGDGQSFASNTQAALADRRKFFLVLAFIGSVWFISVPLAAALSMSLPQYYRLKAILAVSYTFNFLLIALCSLWLYPERRGIYQKHGGGIFLNLSWPTFSDRGTEWQEIQEPLLTNPLRGTPASASVSSSPLPRSQKNHGREATGAQALYDTL